MASSGFPSNWLEAVLFKDMGRFVNGTKVAGECNEEFWPGLFSSSFFSSTLQHFSPLALYFSFFLVFLLPFFETELVNNWKEDGAETCKRRL